MKDLKLHSPSCKWDIDDVDESEYPDEQMGRDERHTKLVWVSVCVWDDQDKKMRQHRHTWAWPYEVDVPLPTPDGKRFYPLINREGQEHKLNSILRKHFK